jgi:hypothetical protein
LTQAEKLLTAMRANPRGWKIGDVERVCRQAGLICSPPSSGSHYKISHPAVAEILTVPFKRPIKPVYIRALVRMIDEVSPE